MLPNRAVRKPTLKDKCRAFTLTDGVTKFSSTRASFPIRIKVSKRQ